MKKWTIVAAVTALASFALVPAVSAAEAETGTRVSLEGQGLLWAGGRGRVEINGAGRVRLAVDGEVTIVDRAGDARIWVRGALVPDATTLTLEDFHGVVRLAGSDFTVAAGGRILLRAAGSGYAQLEGNGWYRVHHGGRGRWPGLGTDLAYPA